MEHRKSVYSFVFINTVVNQRQYPIILLGICLAIPVRLLSSALCRRLIMTMRCRWSCGFWRFNVSFSPPLFGRTVAILSCISFMFPSSLRSVLGTSGSIDLSSHRLFSCPETCREAPQCQNVKSAVHSLFATMGVAYLAAQVFLSRQWQISGSSWINYR